MKGVVKPEHYNQFPFTLFGQNVTRVQFENNPKQYPNMRHLLANAEEVFAKPAAKGKLHGGEQGGRIVLNRIDLVAKKEAADKAAAEKQAEEQALRAKLEAELTAKIEAELKAKYESELAKKETTNKSEPVVNVDGVKTPSRRGRKAKA